MRVPVGLQGECRLVHLVPPVQDLGEGAEKEGEEAVRVSRPRREYAVFPSGSRGYLLLCGQIEPSPLYLEFEAMPWREKGLRCLWVWFSLVMPGYDPVHFSRT